MDSATLARGFSHVASSREFATATSLLVVRNGTLVAEGYFADGQRDKPNDTRSVTKSVTSLLIGIAIRDGKINGVRQPLSDFYPEYLRPDTDPRKRAITLEDLLTMRSGLRWDEHANNDRAPLGMYRTMNSIRYVLQFGAIETPGRVFRYSTGNSQLLAGAIRRGTGNTPFELARERIFGPLGITAARWATHADGNSYGGVRLFLTSRDMAKIGQLCLQNGVWEGRQIVPAEWIATSTRGHSISAYGPYGYHWWVRARGYTAQGFGGQYVYVIPGRQLVIVMTADPNVGHHIDFGPVERLIDEYIVGAVRPVPGPL
jgi:CubicO group peptidase (beta-lactamase class C family)